MKKCFKCSQLLPYSQFYRHPRMSDGHLNKCKECNKQDVQANYRANKGHYVAYEKARFHDPERKAKVLAYQAKRRRVSPEKNKAWQAVSYAIRSKRLVPQPCEVCGNPRSQGHHDDYSKPLDVRWLCFKHHREHHGQQVTGSQADVQTA